MKSNPILGNKLRNYSILASSALAVSTAADGQIIYHNINPDTFLNANETPYKLDLNGDGIFDVSFRVESRYNGDYYYAAMRLLHDGVSFDGFVGMDSSFIQGLPYVVNTGDQIGPSAPWGKYSTLMTFGQERSTTLAFYAHSFAGGRWNGKTSKFVALRIKSGSQFNYGWARISVATGGRSITVMDYAYQETLNTPIIAGETGITQTKLTIQSNSEKCANVVSNPRKTAGGDHGFWAARLTETSGAPVIIRSFLQFDLSSIPAGSFINWARLSLFSTGQNFGPNTSLLRRISSPWDPATVSWLTQPATTKRGAVTLPMSSNPAQDYKNINVTNLVQAMVDSPATSFGFALKLDTEQNGSTESNLIFYSPSYGKTHDDPKLVLEYTNPGLQHAVTAMQFDNWQPSEMTIYPNPCNGIFNCDIKSASSEMTLKVIDMFGRVVYSKPLNASSLQMQVDLSSVSSGAYFVVLQDDKNGTLVSQQLQVN